MLSLDFLTKFKLLTEQKWGTQDINPSIYGFQFQRGTRWNTGLPDEKIKEYEDVLGVKFPDDFRVFLREMNGTDLPTLNIYGYCGEPPRTSVGVYPYPRDLEFVQQLIEDVRESREEIAADLESQGFALSEEANLVPIFSHRYVVCAVDPSDCAVLSIVVHDVDAIVYGSSLQEYLEKEFLG